jgi:hypothetical protein
MNHSEVLGVDGRIIFEWVLGKIKWKVVNLMHLAEDRYQWRALVNTVTKLRVL